MIGKYVNIVKYSFLIYSRYLLSSAQTCKSILNKFYIYTQLKQMIEVYHVCFRKKTSSLITNCIEIYKFCTEFGRISC